MAGRGIEEYDVYIEPMETSSISSKASSGPDEVAAWHLYREWSHGKDTSDGSPDSPRQEDVYSCAIFMLMNALNLAFGFEVACYSQ